MKVFNPQYMGEIIPKNEGNVGSQGIYPQQPGALLFIAQVDLTSSFSNGIMTDSTGQRYRCCFSNVT